MSSNPSYIAGMQEVVGKTLAFVGTTIGFLIFAYAKDNNNGIVLTPLNVLSYLALFWFVYELLSYIMFVILSAFARNSASVTSTNIEEAPVDKEM
jgi:type IV secretory pathway TrbL component